MLFNNSADYLRSSGGCWFTFLVLITGTTFKLYANFFNRAYFNAVGKRILKDLDNIIRPSSAYIVKLLTENLFIRHLKTLLLHPALLG